MDKKFINQNKYIFIFILIFLNIISCQQDNNNSFIDNCIFGNISINNSIINEINEDILNEIIILNYPNLFNNSVLMLFGEEYQIFLFRISNCTNKFLYDFNIEENNFNNKLHLFSIDGNIESNPNIIKLVIQTKKEFQIFYYENLSRIYSNPGDDTYFNLKINIFPYFLEKILFNENEKIFNDICFIYESFNITKPPELRKSLYFYKNNNLTYPLLNSNNNCFIFQNTTSYEDEIFLLEYKCRKNFNVSSKDIKINGISIVSKENIEEYKGSNSLKDQKEILKCNKEGFKSKYIKDNVGFHLSLLLIFIVFICLILLIIQKYEIKYEEEIMLLDAPPKKKTLKESLKEKKDKKNINYENIDINPEKDKSKRKRKKKKKIINSDNDEENKEYNDDLNWYSNNIISDDQNEKEESEKPKKIKKKKKKKKQIYNKAIIEKNKVNNSYDDNNKKNEQDSDYNYKKEEYDIKNKTMTKFPNAYQKFQINSVNQLKQRLNLKRLVIITNLGNNLEKPDNYVNNNRLKNQQKNKNERDSNNSINNSESDNDSNIKNSINNLMDNTKEKSENEKEINIKNEKLGNIIGIEDNTFLSNIMRDYLNFEDASYFDRRENCHIFCHLMKLKNDLINIFCCDYSFAPYTIRIIKFTFFFHFMLYLEILCIGQKYYFEKYYSNDFQKFLVDNNFYSNNISKYSTLNNSNTSEFILTNYINNTTFLKDNFDVKEIELTNIHYLYTFKHAFPRVLIPAAISLISYIFTSLLSPRRKIMKILLNIIYKPEEKHNEIKNIAKNYKIIFILFGIIALLLMIFYFYSVTIYFSVFENDKYDIPQSLLLSGLLRFIFDIILWSFITELRVCSIQTHFEEFYDIVNKLYEMN